MINKEDYHHNKFYLVSKSYKKLMILLLLKLFRWQEDYRKEYSKDPGKESDVRVTVDHIDVTKKNDKVKELFTQKRCYNISVIISP